MTQTGYSTIQTVSIYPPLKPCPFCNSEAIACNWSFPHVRCSSKECQVALFDETVEKAIEKWNRRVNE